MAILAGKGDCVVRLGLFGHGHRRMAAPSTGRRSLVVCHAGPLWPALALCAAVDRVGAAGGPWRRRMLLPLAAAALLVFGPLMGFCLSWARLAAPSRPAIRVLTCNLKGHCNDNAALDDLIRDAAPDIVALQGCFASRA